MNHARAQAEQRYRAASFALKQAFRECDEAEAAVYEASGCRYADRTRSNTMKRLRVRNRLGIIDDEVHRQFWQEATA